MPTKKMKTNQDGGSVTAKNPGAAAKELKKNEDSAAKMGYKQEFGAARMSPSKRGDKVASELMHGAGRYYDGAGQYMNGAPKYEGAAKHHGAPDMHKGPMDMHKGPMDMHEGPMDAGHGGATGHVHEQKLDNVNVDSSISNMRTVLDAQKNRAKRRDQEVGKMLEKDSLALAVSGDAGKRRAKEIYGEEYLAGDRVSEFTKTGLHSPSIVGAPGSDGYTEFKKRRTNFMKQFDLENPFPTSIDQIDPKDKPKYD